MVKKDTWTETEFSYIFAGVDPASSKLLRFIPFSERLAGVQKGRELVAELHSISSRGRFHLRDLISHVPGLPFRCYDQGTLKPVKLELKNEEVLIRSHRSIVCTINGKADKPTEKFRIEVCKRAAVVLQQGFGGRHDELARVLSPTLCDYAKTLGLDRKGKKQLSEQEFQGRVHALTLQALRDEHKELKIRISGAHKNRASEKA